MKTLKEIDDEIDKCVHKLAVLKSERKTAVRKQWKDTLGFTIGDTIITPDGRSVAVTNFSNNALYGIDSRFKRESRIMNLSKYNIEKTEVLHEQKTY